MTASDHTLTPFKDRFTLGVSINVVCELGWFVSSAGRPFAYMQDYTVHGWADHHFHHLPEGSRGIDQFIGEPDMIGKGHGPAFIVERLKMLFDKGVPVVATDPHPKNTRAIAAYKKAGFEELGPAQETRWGPILPMAIMCFSHRLGLRVMR